jgi:hypothetical protein
MGECQESATKYIKPWVIAKSQLQNTQNHGDCQESASKYTKPWVNANSQLQNT